MVGYETVVANIEPPKWKDKDIIDVQDTQDIINDLVFCFKKYNDQAKPIAKHFSTGYIGTDAKGIWSFIKNNISYVAEPEKFQTTRSFSRIIHDKFGDCKHSALLASSIGWNLGYNIIFRFVSYDKGTTYGHVYTLIENPKTGKRFVIDPLQSFNEEKYFYKKVDYKATNNLTFKPMLSRLTGIQPNVPATSAVTMSGRPYAHPDEEVVTIGTIEMVLSPALSGPQSDVLDGLCGIGKRSPAQRKEHRQQTKTVRQEKHTAHKDVRTKKKEARGGSVVKKVSMAPVRGAYSGLLLVNFRGFATRLSQALTVNEPEVRKFAAKLGYKFDNLKSQIIKGGAKKPLFGSKMHGVVHEYDGIGIIVDTAAVAAAAPAIILTVQLFKKLGIGGEGSHTDSASLTDAAKDISKGDTNISVDSGGGSALPSGDGGGGSAPYPDIPGGGGGSLAPSGNNAANTDGRGGDGGTSSDNAFNDFMSSKTFGLPTPLLIIGGIGLLYVGSKKFKIF